MPQVSERDFLPDIFVSRGLMTGQTLLPRVGVTNITQEENTTLVT